LVIGATGQAVIATHHTDVVDADAIADAGIVRLAACLAGASAGRRLSGALAADTDQRWVAFEIRTTKLVLCATGPALGGVFAAIADQAGATFLAAALADLPLIATCFRLRTPGAVLTPAVLVLAFLLGLALLLRPGLLYGQDRAAHDRRQATGESSQRSESGQPRRTDAFDKVVEPFSVHSLVAFRDEPRETGPPGRPALTATGAVHDSNHAASRWRQKSMGDDTREYMVLQTISVILFGMMDLLPCFRYGIMP
jgi:hypothetical protein